MRHDIAILDDQYRYIKHIHVHDNIYNVLFKKLVTPEEYPMLSLARDNQEDLTIAYRETPGLLIDVEKLEDYLKTKSKMSDEVLSRCLEFTGELKKFCGISIEQRRSIEFVAGE
jgi:hypothetical protein